MQPSMFNLRVPLPARDEVFLMNTLTDAQLIVSRDVADVLDRCVANSNPIGGFRPDEWEAFKTLADNGFLVASREVDRRNLDAYLDEVKSDTSELNVTVLTTLQCNFACDYCFQGDHGDYNKHADRMSLETALRVGDWIERELERVHPEKLVMTFFGGEPLLNLSAMYELADRMWHATQARDIPMYVDNIPKVAGRCRIAIGGNFDESSVDSFPALLDFLSAQEFSDKLVKVNFKPVVRPEAKPKGFIPLTPVGKNGNANTHLNGTCMTSAGAGSGSACGNCDFIDDKMAFIRQETKRHGFATADGVHEGPCHVHKQHAHTIGPDGSLYACPGFTGQLALSTGHIDDRKDSWRESAREKFDRLAPWSDCGDCAFIPVCAGGCVASSQSQLGDMNLPTCHKRSFESAVISLAHDAASVA